MKIGVLSTGHHANDDRIFYKEARSLAKAGHSVTILIPRSDKLPANPDGVNFMFLPPQEGKLERFRNLLRLYRMGTELRADVYHCHEPDSLLIGAMIKRRTGAKLIFDSHELWGGHFYQRSPRWLAGTTSRVYGTSEAFLARRCDAGIGATYGITDHLNSLMGRSRTITLLNVPAAEVFTAPAETPKPAEFVICHDGHLRFNRGLKEIVRAVHQVAAKAPVIFKIVGDVFGREREWLEDYVRRHRLENNVQITGWLPYEKVGAELAGCHLGIVALKREPNHIIAAPNKIFNYLLYGLPFIGPEYMTFLQRMESEDKCCVLADCEDADALADTIRKVVEDQDLYLRLRRNAAMASEKKYRWEHMEPELLGLYRRLGSPQG